MLSFFGRRVSDILAEVSAKHVEAKNGLHATPLSDSTCFSFLSQFVNNKDNAQEMAAMFGDQNVYCSPDTYSRSIIHRVKDISKEFVFTDLEVCRSSQGFRLFVPLRYVSSVMVPSMEMLRTHVRFITDTAKNVFSGAEFQTVMLVKHPVVLDVSRIAMDARIVFENVLVDSSNAAAFMTMLGSLFNQTFPQYPNTVCSYEPYFMRKKVICIPPFSHELHTCQGCLKDVTGCTSCGGTGTTMDPFVLVPLFVTQADGSEMDMKKAGLLHILKRCVLHHRSPQNFMSLSKFPEHVTIPTTFGKIRKKRKFKSIAGMEIDLTANSDMYQAVGTFIRLTFKVFSNASIKELRRHPTKNGIVSVLLDSDVCVRDTQTKHGQQYIKIDTNKSLLSVTCSACKTYKSKTIPPILCNLIIR